MSPQTLLRRTKSIAIVGVSNKPERASYQVAAYLQNAGYRLAFVNPAYQRVLGQPCYASLSDLPEPVDMVNIFRKAEDCPAIAEEAIRIGAKSLWLQLGIVSDTCSELAAQAHMDYIEDRCIKIEHTGL